MAKLRVSSWFPSFKGEPGASDQARRRLSGKYLLEMVTEKVARSSMHEARGHAESQTAAKSPMILLAERILSETEKMETHMKHQGVPPPGFGVEAPTDIYSSSNDIRECLRDIASATSELYTLARGPEETLRWTAWSFVDCLSLQILNKHSIAELVPLDAPISLEDLSAKTTLDPVVLARALRHAMTNRIFQEPSPGFIAHTAVSRLLVESQHIHDWVGFNSDETFLASAHVLKALEASPEATSLTQSGFNFANGTVGQEPMFVTLGRDHTRAKRLGGAMANFTGGEGYQVSHLVDNLDLSRVDQSGGTFVDVGGSHGFVTVDLARRWEGIKFVVQDLPSTIASAPIPVCEDEAVSKRIEFQAHDFFTEQPVKNADVYFFRWIIHNYSALYAISILQNLIPALKPGARVVINEHCLSEPGREGGDPWEEKLMRGMDMVMLALLNAEERDELAFRNLFAAADARFEFQGVRRIENCRMSVIEAIWNPDKADVAQGEEIL